MIKAGLWMVANHVHLIDKQMRSQSLGWGHLTTIHAHCPCLYCSGNFYIMFGVSNTLSLVPDPPHVGLSAYWRLHWSQNPCFISSFRIKGIFPHWYFPPAPPLVTKTFWLMDLEKETSPLARGLWQVQPQVQLHYRSSSGGIWRGGRLSKRSWYNFHPHFTHYSLIFCFRKCCQKSEMASLVESLPAITNPVMVSGWWDNKHSVRWREGQDLVHSLGVMEGSWVPT